MFKHLQHLWRRLAYVVSNGKAVLPGTARLTSGLRGREEHEFVVIGLGRFGSSVAETLVRGGHDVLAIDLDERRVHHLSAELPHVVQMDATNADALRQIGIETFDTGLVCIGSDFESNLLATVLLLRFGVKRVITKARTRTQRTILESVGAHEVILPEQQAGVHLGRRLAFKHFIEYLEISEDVAMVELRAPPSLWGRTLIDANLRQRYHLNVIAVHRGPEVIVNLHADFRIEEGDVLAVIGRIEDAERLRA
jgi:trk system potassium uptake protein